VKKTDYRAVENGLQFYLYFGRYAFCKPLIMMLCTE